MSPARWWRGQRAAARVARRELRRHPWRSALVVGLVMVPVAGMVMASTFVRTAHAGQQVSRASCYRGYDATVSIFSLPAFSGLSTPEQGDVAGRLRDAKDLVRQIAPTAVVQDVLSATGEVVGPDGESVYLTLEGPVTERTALCPGARVRGRMPSKAGEVAITRWLADRWALSVGDDLRLVEAALEGTVVGVIADAGAQIDARVYMAEPPAVADDLVRHTLWIRAPEDRLAWDRLLETLGARSSSRSQGGVFESLHVADAKAVGRGGDASGGLSRADQSVLWSQVAGGTALTVAAIVMAAALTVSARRQLRTLGMLSANGAPLSVLRSTVLWHGVWAGVAGTACGAVLGVAGLAALAPEYHRRVWWAAPTYTARPSDLLPILLLGIVAPLAASLPPARSVQRLSTLQALAGRRPVAPPRGALLAAGAVACVGGLILLSTATLANENEDRTGVATSNDYLWAFLALLGSMAIVLGITALTPGALQLLDRAHSWARGSMRLALRSIVRQRARCGAVVAAVAVSAGLALAGSALVATTRAADEALLPPDIVKLQHIVGLSGDRPFEEPAPSSVVEQARRILPAAEVVPVRSVAGAVVGDPAVLTMFRINEETRRRLERHGAVWLGADRAQVEAERTVFAGSVAHADQHRIRERIVAAPAPPYAAVELQMMITPELASSLTSTGREDVYLDNPAPLRSNERAGLSALSRLSDNRLRPSGVTRPTGETSFNAIFEGSGPRRSLAEVYALLAALALVASGFVVAVGLALAAVETRDETAVLHALGAAPRTLRRLAALKAAILTAAGVAIAVPAGLMPMLTVFSVSSPAVSFKMPWLALGFVVVLLPLAVTASAFVGSAVTSLRRQHHATAPFAAD